MIPRSFLVLAAAALPAAAVAEESVALGSNAFGWALVRRLAADAKSPNVVVSPASVSFALAMALEGASPEVASEMRRVLGISGVAAEGTSEAYAATMRKLLEADPKLVLRIANSMWYRTGLSPNADYTASIAKRFRAEVHELDFSSPAASKTINRWVDAATAGKIPAIVPDVIDRDMALFLIDTVYFKAAWTSPFDAKLTHDDSFTTIGGARVPCRLMQRTAHTSYVESADLQAVRLPYGKGAFRATIILPREGTPADALVPMLEALGWPKLQAAMREREGTLQLPRFVARYEAALNDSLRALGMPRAFSDPDAFPRIASRLQISDVKHATFIEVNEEGTEAAAATSIGMKLTALRPDDAPFVMKVDRPFWFVVDEIDTGAVLFVARIGDPSAAD